MILNKVLLYGRMTRNPIITILSETVKIANFSLAIPKRVRIDGEYKNSVSYIDCKAFNKTAEFIEKFFKEGKGKELIVDGSLESESWQDKETGKNRTKNFTLVKEIHFVDKQKSENIDQREEKIEETKETEDHKGKEIKSQPPIIKKEIKEEIREETKIEINDSDIPF